MAPVPVTMSNYQTQNYEYAPAGATSLPSPFTNSNHSSPRELPDMGYIYGEQFKSLYERITMDSDFQQEFVDEAHRRTTILEITNHCVSEFQRAVVDEINQWRTNFLDQQRVPRRERHSDVQAGGPPKKHKRSESIDTDYEEEEILNPKNPGWQCLFYEHDPRAHPQCGQRRYKRVSELRRHIKTHTLPHYCPDCGYRTAEERRLTNHKCEEGNRKKYQPVTPEDKKKHEQLAKMGVKVGQMRLILFGSTESENVIPHGLSPHQSPFVPSNYSGFHAPSVPAMSLPPGTGTALGSSYPLGGMNVPTASTGYYSENPVSPLTTDPTVTGFMAPQPYSGMAQPPSPPFQQADQRFNNPQSMGHARDYYDDTGEVDQHARIFAAAAVHTAAGTFGDFPLYPESSSPNGHSSPSDTMGQTIPINHPSRMPSMGLQNHSPIQQHFQPTVNPGMRNPVQLEQQPLADYIHGLFGIDNGGFALNNPTISTREMPESEIRKMDDYMKARNFSPEQRRETIKMLTRGQSLREKMTEKTKKLFSLPVRGGRPGAEREKPQTKHSGTQTPSNHEGSFLDTPIGDSVDSITAEKKIEAKGKDEIKKDASDSEDGVKMEAEASAPVPVTPEAPHESKSEDGEESAIKTAAAVTVTKVDDEDKPVVVDVKKEEDADAAKTDKTVTSAASTATPPPSISLPSTDVSKQSDTPAPPPTATSTHATRAHLTPSTSAVSATSSTPSASSAPPSTTRPPPKQANSDPAPSIWRRLSKRTPRHARTRSIGNAPKGSTSSPGLTVPGALPESLGGSMTTLTVIEGGVKNNENRAELERLEKLEKKHREREHKEKEKREKEEKEKKEKEEKEKEKDGSEHSSDKEGILERTGLSSLFSSSKKKGVSA